MQVFVQTNEFAPRDSQYNATRTFAIETTSDAMALIVSAVRAIDRMWRDGYRYAEASVVLLALYVPQQLPAPLFPTRDPVRSAALMRAMDAVADRHGRSAVRVASTAPAGSWNMKRQKLSPRYTTRWMRCLQWVREMKAFGLHEVAEEILSIWGEAAERICSRKAQDTENDGD